MPIKVIDKNSQQEIEVSSADAQRGIQQGEYVLPSATARVTRGGRTATVPADQLLTVIGQGARLVDDEEVADIKLQRDAASVAGQIQGGFEAGVRGISFGATDYLAREAGVDMEAMRARQQALGGLGTAVELGAGLLTGSAIAKGVTKAGGAVARAAGVDLASGLTAPSLARTAVHVAGQGAVEGFAAGAGKEISEASLGDRDLVASQVLAQGGYGAMFGAGAGALIPGMAYAGQGLGRLAVRPVKSVLGKAAGYVDDIPSLDGGVSKLIASPRGRDALAAMWGVPRAEVDVWANLPAADRAALFGGRVQKLEEAADSIRPIVEGFRATRRISIDEATGLARRAAVERNLPGSAADVAARLDESDAALTDALTREAGWIDDPRLRLPDTPSPDPRFGMRSLRNARSNFTGASADEATAIANGERKAMNGRDYEVPRLAWSSGDEIPGMNLPELSIIDGRHRLIAAKEAGARTVLADVQIGTDGQFHRMRVRLNGTSEGPMTGVAGIPKQRDALARIQLAAQEKLNELDGFADSTLAAIKRGEISVSPTAIRSVKAQIRQARLAVLREADPTDFEAIATAQLRDKGKFAGSTTATQRRVDQRVVAATAFTELDRLKQHIDRLVAQQRKIAHAAEAGSPTADVLADMGGRLRTHLEDVAIHGKAGTMQAERNALMSVAAQTRKNLSGASKNITDASRPLDNADLLTVMRNGGTWRGATKTETLLDHVGAESDLIAWHLRNSELDDMTRTAMKEQLAANKSLLKAFDDRKEIVRAADIVDRWRGQQTNASPSDNLFTTAAPVVGGIVGSALGGVPGALIGGALGMATKPYNMARMLSMIEARAMGARTAQLKAIAGFLGRIASGATRQAGKAAAGVAEQGARAAGMYAAKENARADELTQVRKRTGQLMADPSLLASEIGRMTADIEEVAPNIATEIGNNVRRATTYLAAKAPKGYQAPFSSKPPLIDPVAEAKYERCVEGTLRPFDALAKLSTGAFTKEHAEAIQFVHPAIYKMEQARILEAMATAKANGKSIPLEDASQISVFFNVPADPTLALAPGIAMAMTPPAQEQGGPQSSPVPSGRKPEPIDEARFATPVQQIGQIK